MARAEIKLNLTALEDLAKSFDNPALLAQINGVAARKEILALVAQAIADNFAQEGPGWAPLKGATIRASVQKAVQKRMVRAAQLAAALKMGATKLNKNGQARIDASKLKGRRKDFTERTNREIEAEERRSRLSAEPGGALGVRQILRRTSLLYQTVTTPNANASFSAEEDGKARSGNNIARVEGTNLIYGTNLVYAATHQNGRGNIPKREYLVIREEWRQRLVDFTAKLVAQEISKALGSK